MAPIPSLTVFDLETTGLDPRKGHRIIEIAGVRVENGKILEETAFVSFVNPERDIPFEAQRINKIADGDVKDAPTIDAVLPQFLMFAQDSVLVAHNAAFDAGFLTVEKEYCWGYTDLPEILCTMQLSRTLFPHEFRHNLDVIARKFNLSVPEKRHRALADTVLAAQALLKMLETGKIQTWEKLQKMAAIRQLVS
ncbi:MAG: 3'-5' exonuclease [Candidatus Peribacteraceae bacterium]|nr:3'-5' exonuclease [Candidatus Peribacteraceae bacterium]